MSGWQDEDGQGPAFPYPSGAEFDGARIMLRVFFACFILASVACGLIGWLAVR